MREVYLFPQVLGLVGVAYGAANQTRQKWTQQGTEESVHRGGMGHSTK